MGTKFETGDSKVVHRDLYGVDPAHIDASHKNNGRYFEHDPVYIRQLAESIIEHGQEQPCKARKYEGNKLSLVSGYGRHAAVSLINTDPELRAKAGLADGENMKLYIVYAAMNAEEAFVHNLVENKDRRQTSAIDDVVAQRRLTEMGWDDDRIASFYKVGVPWIQRLRKLLTLTEAEKRLVHTGKLPVMEAMNLSSLPEDERKRIVDEATQSDGEGEGEIDTATLNEKLREARNKDGKGLGRTATAIRKDMEAIASDEDQDAVVRRFAKDFLQYIKGKVGQVGLVNAIERVRSGEAAE